MALFVKVKTFSKDTTCYTFGATGTGPFSCLIENTGLKKWHIVMRIKFTMNLP